MSPFSYCQIANFYIHWIYNEKILYWYKLGNIFLYHFIVLSILTRFLKV